MLTTDFATYAGRRTRPFALPLTLTGHGCAHSTRVACWRCRHLAVAYEGAMEWAMWMETPMKTRSCV